MVSVASLMTKFPREGRVDWIGVRPARREPLQAVQGVEALLGKGLAGDHYSGRSGNRAVTLIQAEHLPLIRSLLGDVALDPGVLRRNLVVSGINLLALKGRRFKLGTATLEGTGACHPCSRMEEALGPGGYNLMRGHGGIIARVVGAGAIRVGDAVLVLADDESPAASAVRRM